MMTPYRLYFIRRADTHEIKIGISIDVPRRFGEIQACHGGSLELMGSVLGGGSAERRLLAWSE